MIAELQSLVCRMFDQFNFKPLQASEAERPSLVRFEIRSGSRALLLAARNEASELELLELDMEAVGQLLGRSKNQGDAPPRYVRGKSDFRVVFDDVSSWLPRVPRVETSIMEETPVHKAVLELLKEDEFDEMLSLNKKGLLDLCEDAAKAKLCSMSYLGPIRAYPGRDIKVADFPESKDCHGWYAWRRLALNPPLCDSVNAWLKEQNYSLQITVGHNAVLETFGQNMCSHALERIKRVKEAARCQEDLEQSTTCWNILDWNAADDLQNSFKSAASAIMSEASMSVFLKDAKSGKTVSCRDIGVGISQLIPVLVQAMDSRKEIIVMEQPELHLHPRLQAELGDVFIESALGRGNTFVLETHSEHLILRLLRRIRETTEGELPDGKYALTPDQICVLYVEPGEQGSKILQLPVAPDGDFRVPWPGGFFAERATEIFGPSSNEMMS